VVEPTTLSHMGQRLTPAADETPVSAEAELKPVYNVLDHRSRIDR
jgi:hypothetical protein